MKKMSHYLSRLILSLIPIFLVAEAPYSQYSWEKVSILPNAKLPSIPDQKYLSKFRNIIYAKDSVFWVMAGKEKKGLLEWNLKNNQTKIHILKQPGIRGLTFDPEEQQLIIRDKASLLYYQLPHMKKVAEKEFHPSLHSWNQILIQGKKMLEWDKTDQNIVVYDKKTLEKIKTIPMPGQKIQNMFFYDKNRILLFSSYWGSKLLTYNTETEKIENTKGAILYHYHGLFSAAMMDDGNLGVFDLFENKIAVMKELGNLWSDIYGAEQLKDGLAYRAYPIQHKISGSLEIRAKESMNARKAYLVIPPAQTYLQKLHNEEIFSLETLFTDNLGNRYLKLSIPALKKGQSYQKTFYSADLTRYKVSFDLNKIQKNLTQLSIPDSLKKYLKINPELQLDHPDVKSYFHKEFGKIHKVSDLIQVIYEYAVNKVKGKWDGKNDTLLKIIQNMHGGCTEHSYYQMGMLRLAGIPARFNWNHFGSKDLKLTMNHKIAEAWLPETGWFPMEPLGSPRLNAGELSTYNFIFAVRDQLYNPYLLKMDRLAGYADKNPHALWANAPIEVKWELAER